jgi:hypothetical protein
MLSRNQTETWPDVDGLQHVPPKEAQRLTVAIKKQLRELTPARSVPAAKAMQNVRLEEDHD